MINYKNCGKNYITGDLNSRTSREPDYLDFDKYLDDDIFIQAVNSQGHSRLRLIWKYAEIGYFG